MRHNNTAFTLLEAMVSLFLLAVVGGSAVVFFGDLFADNRRVDERHHAAICLETVADVVRHRARDLSASQNASGTLDGLSYQVEDLGYLSHRVGAEFLNLKRLRITLEYSATQADKSVENRILKTEILVGQ